MNKAAIQRFAMKARTDLIEQVSQRAYQYGITKDSSGEANAVTVGGRALSTDEQRQRRELVEQVGRKGYTQAMEEVAYTWFNRFIALRFMEVNNYLPSHIRVFSDSTGAFKPEILNDVLHLDLPGLNTEKVAAYIESNQTEDLYRYLLLTQCNALNEALPQMFEKMGGYTELLLPNNILKQDSVLGHMVADIPEADWTDQVQIIGWLYQYYNSELKDDTFALLKKNVKITKERIPSATQLFTPDWIVRYMVENSLGRIFIDKRKKEGVYADGRGVDELSWEELEAKRIANEQQIAEQLDWKYYLPEAEQTQEVRKQLDVIQNESGALDVKSIKVIDPCMGSGHILVYAFDVLVQIYKEYGISERDAAQSILANNLFGLDIDDRAAQLAYFAVLMKARQYDRRIFSRGIQPHVHSIMETNALGGSYKLAMGDFLLSKEHQETLNYLLDAFLDAKEYGSILQLEDRDYVGLMEAWKYTASQTAENVNMTLWYSAVEHEIPKMIEQAIVLSQKYDVVVTNPPYMGASGMSEKLNDYIKQCYPAGKADLFAAFIERCVEMTRNHRFAAMITMQAWMFLSSYEQLRKQILSLNIDSLIRIGYNSFPELNSQVAHACAFVLCKTTAFDYKGKYFELNTGKVTDDKEKVFLDRITSKNYYLRKKGDFMLIPGIPLAFTLSDAIISAFNGTKLNEVARPRQGLATGENNRFLRLWHECSTDNVCYTACSIDESVKSQAKWFPYNKGGDFRKWYGNNDYLVNWENDGAEIRNFFGDNGKLRSRPQNTEAYFKEAVTWSKIATDTLAFRYKPYGHIFDVAGTSFFADHEMLMFLQGLCNSCVAMKILKSISPTVNFEVGHIAALPVVYDTQRKETVNELVERSIFTSAQDWDSFEISWDFKQHPLVLLKSGAGYGSDMTKWNHKIEAAYQNWERCCDERFNTLKANEEELNRIFIDIYGLQDELTPEVEDKDVTVRKADLQRDIRSLISYAVGCLFGRYSLDIEGLAYAGGEWDASRYSTIIPDTDNIIPICDDDYFDDDITGRFVKWVEAVYGKETLEENLKFIADALGGKGTPREVIRNYFINDFYADHLKIYQKRPIYWLFDSGKKNGFKALIYMHRYQRDLLARMRTDYVHEQQERYRTQLTHIADAIDHASASERVKLTKQQKKLQEQSLEIQKYEEKIHHLADQNIQIDLDDGVNHNYELFADVLAKRK